MRRLVPLLALGLVGAALACGCFYWMTTAVPRALYLHPQPELAWLKHEFQLDNAEFQRISQLHGGYLPQCREHCRRIDALNDQLSASLAAATQWTPEIESLLNQRAQLRASCQAEMLKHFFEVSRAMPADQAKRYLAWVRENTGLREAGMDHGPGRPGAPAAAAHR